MKPNVSIQALTNETLKLISFFENLRNVITVKASDQLHYNNLTEAVLKAQLQLRRIKKISSIDLMAVSSIKGAKRIFLLIGYLRLKRKLVRYCQKVEHLVRQSLLFFTLKKIKKSYKLLGRTIYVEKKILRVLNKLESRINTALDTAKTVQIQIQKGRKRM